MPCCCPATLSAATPSRTPPVDLVERVDPGLRVHLRAVRVRGTCLADELSGVGVAHDDLDGLRGRIDACDQVPWPQRYPDAYLYPDFARP